MGYRNATLVWNRLMASKITKRLCLLDSLKWCQTLKDTAQKMKFSIKDLFGKCNQICPKLGIWSHLLKKSIMKNLIFCAVGNIIFSRSKKIVESGHDTCYEIVWYFISDSNSCLLVKIVSREDIFKNCSKDTTESAQFWKSYTESVRFYLNRSLICLS